MIEDFILNVDRSHKSNPGPFGVVGTFLDSEWYCHFVIFSLAGVDESNRVELQEIKEVLSLVSPVAEGLL